MPLRRRATSVPLRATVRPHALRGGGAAGSQLDEAETQARACITCRQPIGRVLVRLGAVQCENCREPRRVTHPF